MRLHDGLQLVRAGQRHHVRRARRSRSHAQLALGADPLDQRRELGAGRHGHARSAATQRPARRRSARGARSPPHGRRRAARRPCGPRRSCGRARPRRAASSARRPGRGEQAAEHPRPVVRVVPVDQHAADAVADGGDQAADRGGHHRRAAGLRLQRDQPERLVVRRHRDQVGGPVERRPGRRRSAAAGSAPRRRCRATRPARSARSAGPGRCRWARRRSPRSAARPARGRARAARRRARSSTSGALSGWIRPTNATTCPPLGQAEPAAGGSRPRPRAAGAGRNRSRSTPGSHHARPGPGRRRTGRSDRCASTRVLATSRSASATTCSSPITRALRLGPVAGGELSVLDLGQGVRGVHQRHAPALLGQPADLAGQPVVRVDQVVVAGRRGPPRRAARRW